MMMITKHNYAFPIIKEYGDFAEVMEIFGVKRVGGYGIRKILTHIIAVKTAAWVHWVPFEYFIGMLETAISHKSSSNQ